MDVITFISFEVKYFFVILFRSVSAHPSLIAVLLSTLIIM
jgi:hypothetical protein